LALCSESLAREYIESYPAPAEQVHLTVARGLLEIVNGPANGEVVVEARLRLQGKASGVETARKETATRPPSGAELERSFKRMKPEVKTGPRKLFVRVADSHSVVFDWDSTLQMVIDVKVTIPAGLDVVVQSVTAGITIPDVFRGNLELRSDGGSFFAGRIEGDFIARTDTGSITVREVTGRSELRSDTGLVQAGRLHGPAGVRTLNGSIEVQHVHDRLKIRGSDAELVLGISQPVPESLDVQTSAGHIWVNIDRDAALTVDAVSHLLGNVRVRGLPLGQEDATSHRSSLVSDLNGGGPTLRVRTYGGVISIVGRDPIEAFEVEAR